MLDALKFCVGKTINVFMVGSERVFIGTLVSVCSDWFYMDTTWANNQCFNMNKLVSFWLEEDSVKVGSDDV